MGDDEHLIKQAEVRAEKAELRAKQAESSERGMRASELSYRRLFEGARDGILILNVDTGRIDDVNPFLVELLGFSHAEMVGKTVGELSLFKDILSNQTMLARLQKDGYIRYEDLPLQTKDGRHIDVEFVSNIYQAGDVKVIQCNIRDVSERRLSEQALRESEEKFRSMFTAAATGIAVSSPQGRFLEANAAYCQMLGYTEEEMLARDFASLTHPDDLALNLKLRDELLAGARKSFLMEKRYLKKNGDIVWTRHSVAAVCAASGEILKMIVVAEDITERKQAEDSLVLFRSLIDQSNDSIEVVDPGTYRYLDVNESACTTHGYTRQEMLSMTVGDIDPDFGPALQERIAKELKAESRMILESRHRRKDGTTFPVEVTIKLVQLDKSYIVAMVRDITGRKRAEESLVLFRSLIDQSNDAIEVIEPDTYRYLDVNESACTSHGYTRQEMLSMTVGDIDPATNPALRERVERELQTTGHMTFESRHRRKDGTTFPVEVNLKRVHLDKSYNVAIVRDITERKRMEARFSRLMDSNVQSVFFWNTKGEISDGNDAFLKLTGYTRADLEAGRINWVAMTPPEYADLDRRALKELTATGVCTPFEKEWIRKDGSRVPILIGAAMFDDNPDEGVCFVLDLTERKKIEELFRQSQKMEAVGQLASGVAHDFNNILAVIMMQSELLKTEKNLSPEQKGLASEIGETAQRAAALTRQLLLFSRKEKFEPRELDLDKSIADLTKMLRRTLGENVQLQFKFSIQPLFVHADAGMMDQVLMNLAVNARDAMPNGGNLLVETSAVELDELSVATAPQSRPGAFVCLSVSDTGCGIPPEIMPKIFEPFFTTKDVGKGTGLGLATVFGIVQQHQGWINVYSEVGQGTTFRIYLPRVARVSDQKFVSPTTEPLPGGKETILVVEDEPKLRASVVNMLSRLGYHVLEAADGANALEVWEKHRREIRLLQKVWNEHRDGIHLLLTDMVMPGGITGKDLGERLLQENPGLKVIYVSGYSAEVAGKDFPLQEGVNFLTKPFQAQKLAQTIRSNLDKGI